MYTFYKIISRISKFLSNAFVVIAIPISVIFAICLALVVALEPFLDSIGLWQTVSDAIKSSGTEQILQYCQLAALVILCILVLCWIIFITSWCIKKINFKKIGGIDISRNKEYRNHDINEYQEKLEKYRYRD